jgi:hypothetical protein
MVNVMEKTYSQAGQDVFVLSLFDKTYKGVFVDIGCSLPDIINNTLLLEENGWTGVSLDIADLKLKWQTRKTSFLVENALTCNYKEIFEKHNINIIVDYLNLDIEGEGLRYQALKRVMESEYEFKVITIEHDAYRGYDLTERIPQRKLLNEMGYYLLCSNVSNEGFPFEDWWINPKYFKIEDYQDILCDGLSYVKILENINKKLK